ncbi:hypothetical protein P691DRAFT_776683 [Macrolepiota fuliginosa MF-IS2]|uniref:Uncharacterized protein n=1 Tax=Macrolepiota fuliginosa MF-IS2 TaxID=1400762 RepID=A0A9P6C2N2_9AGAR|nr:hypothetical protein P691DRAFT_776683 [Macrolepiota fuliginosa MF-IS2]
MGGGGDTAKTLEEITDDLRAKLDANARQKLIELGGTPGEEDDVKITVPQITAAIFKDTYKYNYDESPPNKGDNPELIGYRKPELCNVVPPAADQVTCQIDIPEWIRDKAVNDLFNNTQQIVTGNGTDNQWEYTSYNRSYDMTENPGVRSVKCNSTLVYVYGSLLEDGTRAEIALICFCGVYYTADSPTVQAQREIEQDAYKTAPAMPEGGQPINQEQLKTSLDAAVAADFQNEFNYQYTPGPPYPPDSYRAKGAASAMLTNNTMLHAIPNPVAGSDLTSYIDRLYNGLNITIEAIKDLARANTASQYDTIIKTSEGQDRSWVRDRLDTNFDISDVRTNKVRQTGIIKCWYGHKAIDGNTTISMLYIYIMTMIYELEDPFEAQTRDLFNILGNQLRKDKEGVTDDIPYLQLEKWAEDYSKTGFKEKFGFEYNGESTIVPDKKSNGPVIGFSSFFRLSKFPATEQEVQEWIWDSVLSKDHPIYARDKIIENLRNTVVKTVNDDVVGVNYWYTGGTPNSGQIFADTEDRGRDIQMRAYYLFVHGKLQVGPNPEPTERVIVFALGVITSYVSPWGATPANSPAARARAALAKSAYKPALKSATSAKPAYGYTYIPPQRVSA